MIGKITGTIDYVRNNYVVVDVNGVGYKVLMTDVNLGKIARVQKTSLFIHTYVREDQLSLFGFFALEELEMFELLIGVSGIGPKAALGILTIAPPATIKTAIINEDASILTRVSGVGKKTAERVILELQNKVDELPSGVQKEAQADQEVIEALVAMGYKITEARDAVKHIPKEITDVSQRIKSALKGMQK